MTDERTIHAARVLRRKGRLTNGVVAELKLRGVSRYDAFLASKAAKILMRPYRPNVRWIRDFS